MQVEAVATENFPEAHVAVTAESPTVSQLLPAVQAAQVANDDAPVVPRKVPVGQLVQLVEAEAT